MGMGHELALLFMLVGIKVLNYPKSIKYILYFKTLSLKNASNVILVALQQ